MQQSLSYAEARVRKLNPVVTPQGREGCDSRWKLLEVPTSAPRHCRNCCRRTNLKTLQFLSLNAYTALTLLRVDCHSTVTVKSCSCTGTLASQSRYTLCTFTNSQIQPTRRHYLAGTCVQSSNFLLECHRQVLFVHGHARNSIKVHSVHLHRLAHTEALLADG